MVLKGLLKPVIALVAGALVRFFAAVTELFIESATDLAIKLKTHLLNARLDSLQELLLVQGIA